MSADLRARVSKLALGLALILAALGCKAKDQPAPPEQALKLPIVARASEDSNDGRPVYVVVRALDEQGFIEDSYAEVAALVIEPDESVITTLLVFPGSTAYAEIELEEPPAMLGVYGLFAVTKDGGWKLLLEGTEVVDVRVGVDAIVANTEG